MQFKKFVIKRHQDLIGKSGTGNVAHGVQFESGKVVLHWNGNINSIVIHDNIENVINIHCLNLQSVIEWIDKDI